MQENRDHTCVFMHYHLPVPRKQIEHEADRPSAQTSPEGPGKCKCNETNMCDRYSCIFTLFQPNSR